MTQLNSHNFELVYKWLGINLDTLGCIMLDLESIPVREGLPLYITPDKAKFWIRGWVADRSPHITLLYGLLQNGKNYELHIGHVLDGWKMENIKIADIGYFDSPYKDEPYYCIVAHVEPTEDLVEGHQRLEFLPHINTFAGYKPHFTLCYIKKDEVVRDNLIADLKKEFVGKKIKVTGLNLGDKHD